MTAAKDRKRHGAEVWRACAEAGMSLAQAARHLDRNESTASKAAKAHGIVFAVGRRGPAPGTIPDRLASLTPSEMEDYRMCKRKHLRAVEALRAIGRHDLAAVAERRAA